jgi:serine/threonine protein kinase
VRLVTTFEHRGIYNLLFECADLSLHDLLSRDSRPPLWHDNNSFFAAIQGLSSALAALHDYCISGLDTELIGCHHDLKPSNVLVKDMRFLLADFGLSRLKPIEGDSKTLFRGMNYHNAPECLDFDVGYNHQKVGRKSDIWAFGTIVLDILTYLLQGSNGLRDFEQGRKHKSGAFTFYFFHHSGRDHPFVYAHIQKLKNAAVPAWQTVFPLILSTLETTPENRPDAASVVECMSHIALRIQTASVLSRLNAYADSVKNSLVTMELKILTTWIALTGLSKESEDWSSFIKVMNNEIAFSKLNDCLLELERAINGLETVGGHPTVWSVRQLSRPIGRLVAELDNTTRRKLYNHIDIEFLQDIEGNQWKTVSESQLYAKNTSLSHLAMAKAAAKTPSNQLIVLHHAPELENDAIKDGRTFGSQSTLGTLDGQTQTPVLIEYVKYDQKWVGDARKELLQRIQGLASVLETKHRPTGFSTLPCVGFYHAKARDSFGLVFEIPPAATQLKTLKQLLEEIPAQQLAARPSLGDVFELSSKLARSILQFHKASWLHKDISSLNICFACTSTRKTDVTAPFLIGFNHSRPDSSDAFTHGPNENAEQKDFSHPEYLRDEKRFRYIYDYYSLGLVLLEIGLWRPLKTLSAGMSDEDDQSPEALRNFLLKRYVPRLASTMGNIYRNVVEKCLKSDFPDEEADEQGVKTMQVLVAFQENVVAPLSACNA